MFHSFTACLPHCLRGADVPDEPMGEAECSRDGIAPANRSASVRGSQASRSGTTTRFMQMQGVLEDLQALQAWPKASTVLRQIAEGRDLVSRVNRSDRGDKTLKEEIQQWQSNVQRFKEQWAQFQTLPMQSLSEWQQVSRRQLPPDFQVHVDEQLLYAQQDIERGLDAFSNQRFFSARELDASAAEHLDRAGKLIDVFSKAIPAEHSLIVEMLERNRTVNSFAEVDRKLAGLVQDVQNPGRRALPSEGQWSVTSAEAADAPAEPGDVIKLLRTLKEQARALPASQRLRMSFLAHCEAMHREMSKRTPSVSMDVVRQQLNALQTTLKVDSNVRKLRNAAEEQLSKVDDAVKKLPLSLHYRRDEAADRWNRLTVAYHDGDYSKAAQIFAQAQHVNQATLMLAEGDYDKNYLSNAFELRNHYVAIAEPLLNRATTFLERRLKDSVERALAMMDKATDVEMINRCLYELEMSVGMLQTAAANARTSRSRPAWTPESLMGA